MKKYFSLGEFLVDFRKHRNLTQLDFAALLDVDARSVHRWEKNQSLLKVEKETDLAETFKIPHQVIRNLNTDKPIAILFDFNRWSYALSELTSIIESAEEFRFDTKFETQSIESISKEEDFEFVTYIQKNQKNCTPLKLEGVRQISTNECS